ncbi:hypothetical protein M1O24_01720 [Dehalococcoidia bacterium]|nr:hypothetical protein [Dehalococcoidia bacterium]
MIVRHRRSEIARGEDGVGCIKSQRLKGAKMVFPAPGYPDLGRGIEETNQTQYSQAFQWRKIICVLQRSAGDGMQEVDWYGVYLQFSQGKRNVNDVIFTFSHSEDGAAAEFQSRFPGMLQSPHSVLIGMSGANSGIETFTGI